MAKDVIMPVLGMNQDTGHLVAWRKREGDTVEEGEPLMEVETDKAVMEIEAPASGTLADVAANEGEDVPVGRVIARIIADDEPHDPAPPAPHGRPATGEDASPPTRMSMAPASASKGSSPLANPPLDAGTANRSSPRPAASPLARRTAWERGLDLAAMTGSGPHGAVLMRDVADAVTTATPSATPSLPPGEAPAGSEAITRDEIERRLDASRLYDLLTRPDLPPLPTGLPAALARFLAAAVRRGSHGGMEAGVTLQVRGPEGAHSVSHAERRSIRELADRLARVDGTEAVDDGADHADAVLVHAGDHPLDALRPSGPAPLVLGMARPAPEAGTGSPDAAALVLTLRYDPSRVDDAVAHGILRDLARLVADPTVLTVAF